MAVAAAIADDLVSSTSKLEYGSWCTLDESLDATAHAQSVHTAHKPASQADRGRPHEPRQDRQVSNRTGTYFCQQIFFDFDFFAKLLLI